MSKISSPTLYKVARKTEITEIVANAMKVAAIGPDSYNPKTVQAKVYGTYGGLERQTYAQVVINDNQTQQPPGKYDLPNHVSTIISLLVNIV